MQVYVSGAGLELLGSEHYLAEAKEVTEELPQEVMVLNQFLTSASVSHGLLTASRSRGKAGEGPSLATAFLKIT